MSQSLNWPVSDLETHGFTSCAYCNKLVTQDTALVKEFHNASNDMETETFCGIACRDIWYLARLRKEGL